MRFIVRLLEVISAQDDLLKFHLSESTALRHAALKCISSGRESEPSRFPHNVVKEDCPDYTSDLADSD